MLERIEDLYSAGDASPKTLTAAAAFLHTVDHYGLHTIEASRAADKVDEAEYMAWQEWAIEAEVLRTLP